VLESYVDEGDNLEEEPKVHNKESMPTMFVVAMTSLAELQTLKVYNYIKKTRATILIDNGSTHSFIDTH
jgi:hypothetical protein